MTGELGTTILCTNYMEVGKMETKTRNLLILGAIGIIMVSIFVYEPQLPGTTPAVVVGQSCATPGETKTIMCFVPATGQAGTMQMTCDFSTRTWIGGACVATIAPGPTATIPYTPPAATALLVCPEEYASYNVMVEDMLDEEAKPQTLLAETVRIISSSGQQLDKVNTSTSGTTEMKVPCEMDKVAFLTTGDDIYESQDVMVDGVTYSGANVPTYYYKDGTPVAYNLKPALIRVRKWGNLSVDIWNEDPTLTYSNNITIGASGDSQNYIRFKVKQLDDDEAGQGVIVLLEYTPGMTKKIEIEGATSGLSARKDSSQKINDYSWYETAWRLYSNNQPLTLDKDTRTAELSEAEFILKFAASSTNPVMNITVQPIDSMRFLAASGMQIGWAHGGELKGEDDDLVNLGMTSGYEMNDSIEVN